MRALDFSPFFHSFGDPFSYGFDRVGSSVSSDYNLERLDDTHYRLSLSVAGFSLDDLSIESKSGSLTVSGTRSNTDDADDRDLLVSGLPTKNFERSFSLSDYIEVESASLDRGILHIDLVRELPESLRTRQISITDSSVKLDKAA